MVSVPVPGVPYRRKLVPASSPEAAVAVGRPGNPVKPACPHLGAPLPGQPCGGGLRRCNLDGATVARVVPCERSQRVCQTCTLRPRQEFRWVSTAQLVRDSVALAGKLPRDCSGVVGIPRSGMLPASVIATHLHLPLYQLTRDGEFTRVGAGSRGGGLYRAGGPLAVVDDTVYSGDAMHRALGYMAGRRAVFAAVYVRPERDRVVDLYAAHLPSPHLLEWNVCNNGPFAGHAANPVYGAGLALDLDGVIVHDAESGTPGEPYLVPRAHPCRLIATGRPEAHRRATEALLKGLGVRWERLEMFPGDRTPGDPFEVAAFKARHYAASRCGFFVESDPEQAHEIFRASGKPVVCPAAGRVFQ